MEMAVIVFLAAVGSVALIQAAVVVPEQHVYLVERLGRFHRTLRPGLHWVTPLVERVAYRHSQKELAVDIDEEICVTRDRVRIGLDGMLTLRVIDPWLASYEVENHLFGGVQLARTLIRREIGQIELDDVFVERDWINVRVAKELDKATAAWGVRVARYEIRNITPPRVILEAMEKELRAEREARASVLLSEASREAEINEAEGHAAAIGGIAKATADGLREVGRALSEQGGDAAMLLGIAEQYVRQLGEAGKARGALVVPEDLTDIASRIELATELATGIEGSPPSCE
jgi:regulator of protease activity HflC (stomatin/prohibitin superfamily)